MRPWAKAGTSVEAHELQSLQMQPAGEFRSLGLIPKVDYQGFTVFVAPRARLSHVKGPYELGEAFRGDPP